MPMTAQQQTDAYQFFVIAFGAAPGIVYMDQIDEAYTAGLTTQEIVNIYTTKSQFTARYPNFLTNEDFATSVVNNVVGNSASASAKAEAVADITAALSSGMTRGDVIVQVFNNLADFPVTDATWGKTAQQFANQVAVAKYVTQDLLTSSTDLATLRDFIDGVTENVATVQIAKDAAAGIVAEAAKNINLTVGVDLGALFTGSSLADTFKANVVQNSLGQQVNTLGSGDELSGGAGTDTLDAVVTAGVFAGATGSSMSMPIQADTNSIEIIQLEAVNASIGGEDTEVYVNAKDMLGVTQIGSNYSDANLVIQSLTTLSNAGIARSVSDMTVAMEYTGNADSRWDESDLSVYFDQDYLTADTTISNPSAEIEVMNEDAFDETEGETPLDGVIFRELVITVNGSRFDLAGELGENTNEDPAAGPVATGSEIKTYAELLAAVQAALVTIKAENLTNAALQTVTATLGDRFFADVNPETLEQREGISIRFTMAGETNGVANELSVRSTDLEVVRASGAEVENNNRYERVNNSPSRETDQLVAINVVLEKVGLAGDGGELIIGSMNKTSSNEWDDVNTTTDTVSGIEQFDVIVMGAEDKSSSLAGLHSTNNNLRVVNVTTDAAQTGSFADLTIGNDNTRFGVNEDEPDWYNQFALKDVQVFNTTGFKGDLTLFAGLTGEVVDKYMDRTDIDAPADDNADFEYTFGAGNDTLNLFLSDDNLAASGTSSREDFTLAISTGGGDDTVVVEIGGEDNVDADTPWFVNTTIQDNLSITTGAGNDTVYANGAGVWNINTGEGNDAIYSDNSGRQNLRFSGESSTAVWVFNTADQSQAGFQDLFDLTSAAAVTGVQKVANLELTVSYFGINVTVNVGDTHTAFGGTVNDLVINQAIKNAINNNVYLSNLLEAEDGPARTLIVTSKTDGVFSNADISISVANPKAISVAQVSSGAAYLTGAQLTALGLTGGTAVVDGRFDSALAEDEVGSEIDGEDSDEANENVIVAGLGNDTVVLSTSLQANETVNVATAGGTAATDSDVVFNATAGASITVDAFDTVITSDGVRIFGGVGTVSILSGIIQGSAGNDTINASTAAAGQGIDGLAGNDTIIGSDFDDVITGGLGGDKMTGGLGDNDFVIGNLDSGLVIASADEITDFLLADDDLDLGSAGDDTALTGNYVEAGAAVADFTAALAAANIALAALAGTSAATELYAFQADASNGYLFNDTDGDGDAEQVIVLVGVDLTEFDAIGIVA